jgi:hypothetical protein
VPEKSIPTPLVALLAAIVPPLAADGPSTSAVAGTADPLFAAPAIVCGCTEGTPENEPGCGVPTDTTNGGCNSFPTVFGTIHCGETVCGTVGTLDGTRDTDWYELYLPTSQAIEITIAGDVAMQGMILHNGSLGPPACNPPGYAIAWSGACGEASTSADLAAGGTFWVFAASQDFTGVACGASYRLTVSCPDLIFASDFERSGAFCFWDDVEPPVICF